MGAAPGPAEYARWVDASLVEGAALPYLDWDRALDAVRRDAGAAAMPGSLDGLASAWLGRLAEAMGPPFRLYATERLLLVSAAGPEEAARSARVLESARTDIERRFRGIAEKPVAPRAGAVLLPDFRCLRLFERRLLGRRPYSGGFLLPGPCPVAVMPPSHDGTTEVHEFAHALFQHLRLPAWVDEGLATLAERLHEERNSEPLPPEVLAEQPRIWGEGRIQLFWSGACWGDGGEEFRASYDLAWAAVRTLWTDREPFLRFLRQAQVDDAGAAALERIYGGTPGELVARWLGPGDWEPRPETWGAGRGWESPLTPPPLPAPPRGRSPRPTGS